MDEQNIINFVLLFIVSILSVAVVGVFVIAVFKGWPTAAKRLSKILKRRGK